MNLTREDIAGERQRVYDTFRTALVRIAELALFDLAIVTRELYPTARWVGTEDWDQDMSGAQTLSCILDGDSKLLTDEFADWHDAFEDVPVVDLDDTNASAWQPFAAGSGPSQDGKDAAWAGTAAQIKFLDINAILEAMAAE